MPAAELERAADIAYLGPVLLHGGEPCLHQDMLRIAQRLRARGCKVELLTNGCRLDSEENAAKLPAFGITSAIVKFYGPEQVHDAVTQKSGSFVRAKSAVELLAKSMSVSIALFARKDSLRSLPEFVEEAAKWPVNQILLAIPSAGGMALKGYADAMPRLEDFLKLCRELTAKHPFLVAVESLPHCQLQGLRHSARLPLGVERRGKVSSCSACSWNPVCPGIYREYIANDGPDILRPVNDLRVRVKLALQAAQPRSLLHLSPEEGLTLLNACKQPALFWQLTENLGYPVPLVVRMLDAFKEAGLVHINGSHIKSTVIIPPDAKDVHDFSNQRLPADGAICQLTVAQSDVEQRVKYVADTVKAGGRLAVVGDDDFLSLAMASTGHFDEIVVFELDRRVCDRIAGIAASNNYPVRVVQHDLRKPMPCEHRGMFEAFYTDPPYSAAGFSLFVSRGIELLKSGSKRHGFASCSPEFPVLDEVELPVQDAINQMGLFIERKATPGINNVPEALKQKYPDMDSVRKAILGDYKTLPFDEQWYFAALGRKEYLFHFLTTARTRPIITGEFKGEIYYENNPLEYYVDADFIAKLKALYADYNFD